MAAEKLYMGIVGFIRNIKVMLYQMENDLGMSAHAKKKKTCKTMLQTFKKLIKTVNHIKG